MIRRILCIDGGGILGLIPALILAEIEARAGVLAGRLFDSASGTSTGGIITCAAVTGIPAKDVVDLYRRRGRQIFSRSWGAPSRHGLGPVGTAIRSRRHRICSGSRLRGPASL